MNGSTTTNEALEIVRARMDRVKEEAIQDVFARFPFGQEVRLFTGKDAVLKVFYAPKKDAEGRWSFGVDLEYKDGSGHLEYTFTQTGWGGKP